MSGLIKAGAADGLLRPLGGAYSTEAPYSAPAPDPALIFEAVIAGLRDEIESLKAAIPAKVDAAYKQGLEAGLKERDEASDKRTALLDEAASSAKTAWDARLASTGQLAILVAKRAIAKLIGNPEWRSELVVGAIERRISALGKAAIVAIRVSGEDFSPDEVAALGVTAATRIEADDRLGSCECRVELAMGHEEIGIEAQWQRLAGLLDELAEGPC